MIPKLFAFDLDGTLLDSEKRIRTANVNAIAEMREAGAVIALVSGRLGAAVRRYVPDIGGEAALVTLNGAEVFLSAEENARMIRYAPLDPAIAAQLTEFGANKPIAVNFYYKDRLHTVKTAENDKWMALYSRETGLAYNILDDFAEMAGIAPSKIIFVGDTAYIDKLEAKFREIWADGSVYVCRSWDHYLEFMNPLSTKGLGLEAVCRELEIDPSDAAAYGDAENDIPMFMAVGMGVAMKNSPERVKAAAPRVTELTNNEDWLAREWDLMKTTAV